MFMVFEVVLLRFVFLEEFTLDFLQNWFPCIFISNSKLTGVYWGLQCLKSIDCRRAFIHTAILKSECIPDAI